MHIKSIFSEKLNDQEVHIDAALHFQWRYQGPWHFLVHIRLFHFAPHPSSLHLGVHCVKVTWIVPWGMCISRTRSFNCYRESKEGYLIKCSLICYSAELEILSDIHLEIKDKMIQNDIIMEMSTYIWLQSMLYFIN